ncbi:MAG: nucleoside diphosphate kinase regulator [Elusimicrobia bacterium]|nr:nucleoside diphosphate kinase regulator [Elusimicrobiota bacterium]
MNGRVLYITKTDCERLRKYLSSPAARNSRDRGNLEILGEEIHKAKIVDSREIAPDVVTMNSRIKLKDMDTNKEILVTLVFPDDSNIEQGKLSVLSPIGTAILGYSLGDIIEWKVPSRVRRIQIKEICYQPEAAGNYDL